MSYSMDMRKRVIAVYEDKKMTQKKISENFGISLSTIKRWLTRTRSGESLIPKTFNSGRPGKIDVSGLETLKNIVKEYPSITLAELSKLYAKKHKIVVGKSVLSRALQALNLRHKKLSVTAFEKENDAVKKKPKNIG